jgi:hypothetical protein
MKKTRIAVLPPQPGRIRAGSTWVMLTERGRTFEPILGFASYGEARNALDKAIATGRIDVLIADIDHVTWVRS